MDTNYNVNNIKNISQDQHDIIFGYVKQENMINIIPKEVIYIILLFYSSIDEWDTNAIGEELTMDGNTIEHTGASRHNTAYLSLVVSEGIHSWKFRADIIKDVSNRIGIWKTRLEPKPNSFCTNTKNAGYAYTIHDGEFHDTRKFDKYGASCMGGEIIEMILNFNDLTLSYIVNGSDQGKACKIEKTSYRACISLWGNLEKTTFISYTRK